MKYARVKITKNPMTVIMREVPMYEVPVLNFVYDGAIEVEAEFDHQVDVTEDGEYDRLSYRYGAIEGKSPVDLVYGSRFAGLFQKSFDEAAKPAKGAK